MEAEQPRLDFGYRSQCDDIENRAREFHERNPEVWTLFVRFSLDRLSRGFAHYSVASVWERIRWETDSGGAPSDGRISLKLNNDFKAHYVRWFEAWYPQYRGFYRKRKLTSAEYPARGATVPDPYVH